jgi:hypothetical protein
MTDHAVTFTGRTPDTTVDAADFLNLNSPQYRSDGSDIVLETTHATTTSVAYKSGFNNALISLVAVFRIVAVGSTANEAVVARHSSAKAGSVLFNTTRTISPRSGNDGALAFTSTAVPLNTWCVLRAAWDKGTTTTNGRVWGRVMSLDETTTNYGSGLLTNVNNLQLNYAQMNLGKNTSASGAWNIQWTAVRITDGVFADGTSNALLTIPTDPATQQFRYWNGTTLQDVYLSLWNGTTLQPLGTI